jgi:uncharacterized protein (DUF1684 family)
MTNSRFARLGTCLLVAGLALSSTACADNTAVEDQDAWLKSVRDAWAEEDAEYKNSPTSPLAGVQRFEIEEASTVYFARVDGQPELSLDQVDQLAFSLARDGDEWHWTGLDEGVSLARGDEAVASGSTLAAGDRLQAGRLTVVFYPSAEKVIVLVFDPDTRRRADFETLDRFEADPEFVVTAKIERFETPERLELVTGRQQFKSQYRYARLHFEFDGEELGLTAYKHALEGPGSENLFIPFTDKTSGPQSYGGGRYLFVEEPADGAEVLIDFNLATNPLCTYAAIYNCIVPTLENKLPVAITAGVKKYDHPDH